MELAFRAVLWTNRPPSFNTNPQYSIRFWRYYARRSNPIGLYLLNNFIKSEIGGLAKQRLRLTTGNVIASSSLLTKPTQWTKMIVTLLLCVNLCLEKNFSPSLFF